MKIGVLRWAFGICHSGKKRKKKYIYICKSKSQIKGLTRFIKSPGETALCPGVPAATPPAPLFSSPPRPSAAPTVKHLNSAPGERREGKGPPSECSWNWKLSASAVRNMWRNYLSFPVETSSNHPNPAFQFGDNMLLSVLIAPCWIQEVLWIVQQAYCH